MMIYITKKKNWFVGSKPQENMKFQQYKIRIAEHEIWQFILQLRKERRYDDTQQARLSNFDII